MADPIKSDRWTGELTHGRGTISVSSDYERLIQAHARSSAVTPEHRRLARAVWLLCLSPAFLWIARAFVKVAISDTLAEGYEGPLGAWTFLVLAIVLWQLKQHPNTYLRTRQFCLMLLAAITIAGAGAYGYFGLVSHAGAVAGPPERTFSIYRCRKGCKWTGGYFVHQRADGSTLEGERVGAPLAYGTTCAEVQHLQGPYGFSWVRVLGRSPPPEHEIAWPIRREDCFSDKPLSELKG